MMFLRQLSYSFPSFHLAIHIIAHLFNFERYSRSRQATDGSLASVLSSLAHEEKEGGSWLNPIQSPNTVSWVRGKASGFWSRTGKAWYPWWIFCQADISFIDCDVYDIHQHSWSHWSDHHHSSGSHGDFIYGVYPEELFWGFLVYTPYFYHLLHRLRDSRHWVRSSNSFLKSQPLTLHNSLSQTVLLCLCQWNCSGSNRREHGGESSLHVCRIFREVGWS